MMDLDYFEVLDFLMYNNGLNSPTSIAPLITKIIPIAPSFMEFGSTAMYQIRRILHKLEKDGCIVIKQTPSPNGNSYDWETAKVIVVELTHEGVSKLEQRSANELTKKVNVSIYETNESVKATNKSLVDTNTKMVYISTKQNDINETIAHNYKR